MTREEEIINEAVDYSFIEDNFIEYDDCGDICDDRDFIQKAFEAGAKWADRTMIEKAKKWLKNFLEKTVQKPSINYGYTSDTIDLVEEKRRRLIEEVLYDFKKAMEL